MISYQRKSQEFLGLFMVFPESYGQKVTGSGHRTPPPRAEIGLKAFKKVLSKTEYIDLGNNNYDCYLDQKILQISFFEQ